MGRSHVFNDKVIAITGAGSGMGRALSHLLSARGATLALCDKSEQGLHETAESLTGPCTIRVFDIRDSEELAIWINHAVSTFGHLDGIINNAGMAVLGNFHQIEEELFDKVMDVNFNAVVKGCRYALPHLKNVKEAWIVNMSSVFGIAAVPTQSPYIAAKFAVRGFTEALDVECRLLNPHIHVLRVHPGGVRTKIAHNIQISEGAKHKWDPNVVASTLDTAITSPGRAAENIVRAMERGRSRLVFGIDAILIDFFVRFFAQWYIMLLLPFMKTGLKYVFNKKKKQDPNSIPSTEEKEE